jgi:hypothetical protein
LGAKNDSERALAGLQKGPSCVATVALSAFNCGSFAIPETEMRKPADFFGVLKPVFHSGWRILVDAYSSILFTTVR